MYAFGGKGQIEEATLDLGANGVAGVLDFLARSFGGGTNVCGAMERVVARLRENDWKKADVLLVSDGEWLAPEALVASVLAARKDGTRFHGLRVGDPDYRGLDALCDPVHLFRDWDAVTGP